MSDRLSVSLQENLLVLLTFSATAAPLIRNAVEPSLFGNRIYRDIITRIYAYLDEYKKPPADHLPDLLEDQLNAGTPEARMMSDLLTVVGEQRAQINEEYSLNQLERFVRQQTLKLGVIAASEAIQQGDLDTAEEALQRGLKTRLSVFSPGLRLLDGLKAVYDHQVRQDVIPTGIPQLDAWEIGPARGEFHLYIAPPKTGKSMWLVHMAKRCLMHRKKVVYLTLELSEAQITQRMVQSLLSITRRKAAVPITRLRTDDLGRLLHFEHDTINGRMSLDDATTRTNVEKRLTRMHSNENLIIKQYPPGQLTVRGLASYLDMLEQSTNFVPDFLVLDYPDYMKIDPKNYRLEAGALYNDLRGQAVERNMGVIVASKSNREGAKAKVVDDIHAAEDFSRIYTADTILTYSQTKAEHDLGLARLYVKSTRVAERDRYVVLISQAYPVCQFALDSAMMEEKYWGLLEQAAETKTHGKPALDEDD